MKIMGVDLHARQQTITMLDTDSGELVEKLLEHESEKVREFYSALSGQILVGIEGASSTGLERMGDGPFLCRFKSGLTPYLAWARS